MKTEFRGSKKTKILISIKKSSFKIIIGIFLALFLLSFGIGFFLGITFNSSDKNTEIVYDKVEYNAENDKQNNTIENKSEQKKQEPDTNKTEPIKLPDKIAVDSSENNNDKKNKYYTIQIYSQKSMKQAKNQADILKTRGYESFIVKTVSPVSGEWYKVRVGKFKTQEQAYVEGKKMENKGIIPSFYIVTDYY